MDESVSLVGLSGKGKGVQLEDGKAEDIMEVVKVALGFSVTGCALYSGAEIDKLTAKKLHRASNRILCKVHLHIYQSSVKDIPLITPVTLVPC